MLMLAIGRSSAMLKWLGTQSEFPHELRHPLLPAGLSFASQCCMNAWTAVHPTIGMIEAHNALPQRPIRLATAAAFREKRPPLFQGK
jgi:hypothetical protein